MTREERLKLMPPVQTKFQYWNTWRRDGGFRNIAGLFLMAVCSTLLGGFSLTFFLNSYQDGFRDQTVTVHVIDHHSQQIRTDEWKRQ
jgi:hypothetical protein